MFVFCCGSKQMPREVDAPPPQAHLHARGQPRQEPPDPPRSQDARLRRDSVASDERVIAAPPTVWSVLRSAKLVPILPRWRPQGPADFESVESRRTLGTLADALAGSMGIDDAEGIRELDAAVAAQAQGSGVRIGTDPVPAYLKSFAFVHGRTIVFMKQGRDSATLYSLRHPAPLQLPLAAAMETAMRNEPLDRLSIILQDTNHHGEVRFRFAVEDQSVREPDEAQEQERLRVNARLSAESMRRAAAEGASWDADEDPGAPELTLPSSCVARKHSVEEGPQVEEFVDAEADAPVGPEEAPQEDKKEPEEKEDDDESREVAMAAPQAEQADAGPSLEEDQETARALLIEDTLGAMRLGVNSLRAAQRGRDGMTYGEALAYSVGMRPGDLETRMVDWHELYKHRRPEFNSANGYTLAVFACEMKRPVAVMRAWQDEVEVYEPDFTKREMAIGDLPDRFPCVAGAAPDVTILLWRREQVRKKDGTTGTQSYLSLARPFETFTTRASDFKGKEAGLPRERAWVRFPDETASELSPRARSNRSALTPRAGSGWPSPLANSASAEGSR